MKIALVAPVEETVPPKKYGGTEWIVYYIASGMGKRGHQVDLYASADSKLEGFYHLVPIVKESLRMDPQFFSNLDSRATAKMLAFAKTARMIQEGSYDIIHNHASWRFLIFRDFIKQKIITTHHGPLNFEYQNMVFVQNKDIPYVSISNNQRKDLPELNFAATVYNGIDIALFPYFEASNLQGHDYMIFLARMSEEKGAVEAAMVARKLRKKLIAAVKVDKVDEPYLQKFIKYVDNQYVVLAGEVDHQEKLKFLQQARCLIAPVQWEEPFGLMFTESMSCGTPVIAFARGSVPEIIEDGRTGFIINSSDQDIRGDWVVKKNGIEGITEAVERIYSMPDSQYRQMRRASRALVEKHFTVEKMVDEYEKLYQSITVARV